MLKASLTGEPWGLLTFETQTRGVAVLDGGTVGRRTNFLVMGFGSLCRYGGPAMMSTSQWYSGMAVSLLTLVLSPTPGPADDYFNMAIAKLDQSLARDAKSFGFTMDETITDSRGETLPFQFKYYTTPGQVHYQQLRLEPSKAGAKKVLSWEMVFVNPGDDKRAQQVDRVRQGNQIVATNLTSKDMTFLIGAKYECQFNGSSSPGNDSLTRPLQLVLSPCVDPSRLDFTPDHLRTLPAELVEDKGDVRVYEIKSGSHRLRLDFSRAHNDAVVKSELSRSHEAEGVPLDRVIRTVEKWQELPGGRVVPARVTIVDYRMGRRDDTVTRDFSNVMVGDVPADMFDVSRSVEPHGRVVAVHDRQVERELVERGDIEGLHEYHKAAVVVSAAPDGRTRRLFLVIFIVVAIGIVAGLLLWRIRARRAAAGGSV